MEINICDEYGEIFIREGEVRLCIEVLECICGIGFDVINVIFLGEEEICSMHGKYLNDYSATDVITFGYGDDGEKVGEIYISIDQAIKVANELRIEVKDEIMLYIVHGWLHLKGYNDLTDEEAGIMRLMEAEMMSNIREKFKNEHS